MTTTAKNWSEIRLKNCLSFRPEASGEVRGGISSFQEFGGGIPSLWDLASLNLMVSRRSSFMDLKPIVLW